MKTHITTDSGKYSQGLKYTLNSDGKSYSISGIGSCTDKDIIIPETYENLPVTSISFNAFYECAGLTSITIPNSVTSIGNLAFYGCTGLTSIIIPDSVTSISGSAFSGCSSLTGVYITDIAAWCHISFGINPLYYAHNLYLNGELVTDLVIPNGVTSIGISAFSGCSSLTSITIPDSVTSIGNWAFAGCTGLAEIIIPDSVTSIGDCAFDGCAGLHKNGTFKATDKDMCCRQFQYNLGEKFETTHASLCHSGFHFCTNAFDLLNYYSGEIGRTVRFFEVKVDKVTEERNSDSKRVCKEITFLREIKSYAELLN